MATTAKTSAGTKKTAAKATSEVTKKAAKKPAATAAAKTPAKTKVQTAAKKPAAPKGAKPRAAATGKTGIGVDQRRHYVEVAAYFIAERRGFMGGLEHEDWLAAETEIDRLLREGKLNS
ncbi:MAG TPA: DUF2934 domain-containing protein [Rhodocyclaceae bacterium]|nr:DUF2934 domain-containing protein [Rhodocyclaceae bacterium]